MKAYKVLNMLMANGFDKDDLLIDSQYDLHTNKNYLRISIKSTQELIVKFTYQDGTLGDLTIVETNYPELFI